MEALGFSLRAEAVLKTLTTDAVKSSKIEGETLDRNQVRSSIARGLGMNIGTLAPADRNGRRSQNVRGILRYATSSTSLSVEILPRIPAAGAAPATA